MEEKEKQERTVIHLEINGGHYYFGSLAAIFEVFDAKTLGITYGSLRNVGVTSEKPYRNKCCIIRKGILHTISKKNGWQKTRHTVVFLVFQWVISSFSKILVADVDVIFDLMAQTVTRRYIYDVFESVFSIKKSSNASNFSCEIIIVFTCLRFNSSKNLTASSLVLNCMSPK